MAYPLRASALHGLDAFAAEWGLNAQQLLKDADLPDGVLERPDDLISFDSLVKLLQLGSERSGQPLFGLQFGLHHGGAVLGPILYLIRNAPNAGTALQELVHYMNVHTSAAAVKLELSGNQAMLCYQAVAFSLPDVWVASERAVGIGYRILEMLMGSRWQPSNIFFQHAPQAKPADYRRLIGLVPQFNSTTNGLAFDARLLERPLSAADPELHRLMRQQLEEMNRLTEQDLPAFIKQLLVSFIPGGRANIEHISRYLLLSNRTLQRQLTEHGTSFNSLLDETRQAMARRYLSDSSINLTQLAELLGYSDLSAFSRAFQRWFKQTPSAWKKEQCCKSLRPHLPRRHSGLHRRVEHHK